MPSSMKTTAGGASDRVGGATIRYRSDPPRMARSARRHAVNRNDESHRLRRERALPRLGLRARVAHCRQTSLSRMIALDAIKEHHGTKIMAQEPHPRRFAANLPGRRRARRRRNPRSAARAIRRSTCSSKTFRASLWWAADRLFSSETFAGLIKIVEHVILDSSGTNTEPNALREFSSYFSGKQSVALGDLAWMRLDPWRDVIAQFFDDPSMRDELLRDPQNRNQLRLRFRSAVSRRLACEPARLDGTRQIDLRRRA